MRTYIIRNVGPQTWRLRLRDGPTGPVVLDGTRIRSSHQVGPAPPQYLPQELHDALSLRASRNGVYTLGVRCGWIAETARALRSGAIPGRGSFRWVLGARAVDPPDLVVTIDRVVTEQFAEGPDPTPRELLEIAWAETQIRRITWDPNLASLPGADQHLQRARAWVEAARTGEAPPGLLQSPADALVSRQLSMARAELRAIQRKETHNEQAKEDPPTPTQQGPHE